MAELVVSVETATQLRKMADETGRTAEELAEQAIRQFLRDESRRAMQRESDAFRAMHPDLLLHYPNEYVAIFQQKIVDHDVDQLNLFKRIEQQYPDIPVLIKQVLPEPDEVYTIRSPKLDRE